jgi:hypothetical protein
VIAADSSSIIAYLAGHEGKDVDGIEAALSSNALCFPPVVLTELFSDPKNPPALGVSLSGCPLLEIFPGYWERAGQLRAKLSGMRLRAKIPDTLIAQSCIDHDVALITRDADFRHFVKHCGLKLG